jgi:rSAM/selenodomain-associated transferase 2
MTPQPSLSVVLPVLNEAAGIRDALAALQPWRSAGVEIVVADGGSSDGTAQLARDLCERVVSSPRGRAAQMNAGAAATRGTALLFLHADTRPPADTPALIGAALRDGAGWGRFDVRIDGRPALLPVIAAMMNVRSRLSGIATGDQAIFCSRALFERLGGFADIALMEDIDFSRRARRLQRPACLRARVLTSGRRWEKHGLLRTVLLMWRLRLRYFFGADPQVLARVYRPHHD